MRRPLTLTLAFQAAFLRDVSGCFEARVAALAHRVAHVTRVSKLATLPAHPDSRRPYHHAAVSQPQTQTHVLSVRCSEHDAPMMTWKMGACLRVWLNIRRTIHAQLPPGGSNRAGGRVHTRPAALPHQWGPTSCHKAAPPTHVRFISPSKFEEKESWGELTRQRKGG